MVVAVVMVVVLVNVMSDIVTCSLYWSITIVVIVIVGIVLVAAVAIPHGEEGIVV